MAESKQRQAASRLRLELRALHREIGSLLEEILQRDALVKGTVYRRRRRCGRPRCHCRKGESHGGEAFSYSEGGKTRHLSLHQVDPGRLRQCTGSYRRFREARASLGKRWQALLKRVDAMESLRRISVRDLTVDTHSIPSQG